MQVWILDLLLLALFETLKVLVSSIEVLFFYPSLSVGLLAGRVGLLPVSCVETALQIYLVQVCCGVMHAPDGLVLLGQIPWG